MHLVTLDFETYWSQTHTLKKMPPLVYAMHKDTEIISLSAAVGDETPVCVFGEDEVVKLLQSLNIGKSLTVGHNMSGFDCYLMSNRLRFFPRLYGCTMAMARPHYAKVVGLSLGALVEHFGLGKKDATALHETRGKHLADFTAQERRAMAVYNNTDTDQCRQLFKLLRPMTSGNEMWAIDSTIRMRTEPKFVVDVAKLETALSIERSQKLALLSQLALELGIKRYNIDNDTTLTEDEMMEQVRAMVASAPKFASFLEQHGIEVPMKASPTNGALIPALAKTDEGFLALLESANPIVATAARCRLSQKSTLLETRIDKFLTAAECGGGYLHIPIKYCGADTTGRDSGEEFNCFTGDVEVLTRGGWVRFDQWDGAAIMQWWPDGSASFCDSPGTLVKHHTGELIDVDAVLFSASMTPDHRLAVVRDGKLRDYTAGDLPKLVGLNGVVAAGRYVGAAESAYTPSEARLMVAIAADGTVLRRKSGDTVVVGLRRKRKIERFLHLMDLVGCDFYTREYPPQDSHTGDHSTVQFVLPKCEYQKGFGPWLLNLSREALDAAVDELRYWDGWSRSATGAIEFYTSVEDQALWVSTALHLSGMPATVRRYRNSRIQLHARESVDTTVPSSSVNVRQYDGPVYCAGVDSTYIFIRRNGKVSVAGQCQNLPRISSDKSKPSNALRYSMKAPPGKVIMVADLSGIELRVNHFLWQVQGSMELYKADPEADLYRAFAAARYNISPEAVSKAQRQLAKVAQLGLGFGAGWATFRGVAKTMGGLDLSDEDAQLVTNDWRGTYFQIVNGWRKCHAHLPDILAGREQEIDPWGLCHTSSDGIVLPSGRIIRYPDLRYEQGSKGKEWWYGQGRHRARIYAGKIDENCLAEGTLVLTTDGWTPIEEVELSTHVHDGVEFVRHGGLSAKGVQECINIEGVWMTPDHEVLENGNWTEASQCQRPDRAGVRSADRLITGRKQARHPVALPLRLWQRTREAWSRRDQGGQARGHTELRVRNGQPDTRKEQDARYEQTSGVRCVALHAGPLQTALASSLAQLRSAWHHGVRRVAGGLRELLERHGANVPTWAGPGAYRQRQGVLAEKLPMGNTTGEHHEQEKLSTRCGRPHVEQADRHWRVNAVQPTEGGLAHRKADAAPRRQKQVFDILNCGPRHRFVVLGEDGPFIVHNCVQALARDVVFGNALDFFKETNLRPSLRVHDELVYVVEEAAAQELLDTLQAIMRTPPSWWPELITWSEGDIAPTYGDAK